MLQQPPHFLWALLTGATDWRVLFPWRSVEPGASGWGKGAFLALAQAPDRFSHGPGPVLSNEQARWGGNRRAPDMRSSLCKLNLE